MGYPVQQRANYGRILHWAAHTWHWRIDIIFSVNGTCSHVSVHWQQGIYRLLVNCFMCWAWRYLRYPRIKTGMTIHQWMATQFLSQDSVSSTKPRMLVANPSLRQVRHPYCAEYPNHSAMTHPSKRIGISHLVLDTWHSSESTMGRKDSSWGCFSLAPIITMTSSWAQ